MVIQRTILGSKRVELQNKPIILPTVTLPTLSAGERQQLFNEALDFVVITWDGDSLIQVTPAAAYQGAFAQYQTRVKQEFDIDIRDQAIIGA